MQRQIAFKEIISKHKIATTLFSRAGLLILYIIGSRNDAEGIVCVKLVYTTDLVNITVLTGSANRIKGFSI